MLSAVWQSSGLSVLPGEMSCTRTVLYSQGEVAAWLDPLLNPGFDNLEGRVAERVDAVNRPPERIRYGWPLHRADWEALPASLQRPVRWRSRPLGHASRDSVPTQAGVYIMCVKPPGSATLAPPLCDLSEVIYVGKTVNLRRRYAEHLNTPSPKVRMARETYSASLRVLVSHSAGQPNSTPRVPTD